MTGQGSPDSFFAAAEELRALLERVVVESGEALAAIADGCAQSIREGGKVLFAGNGGSAAQCQHLATELVCRFSRDRRPYAAIALTTDTSFLTAFSNDYAFERVFARQVEALGREGDALVVLSTSGRSPNVLRAAEAAATAGIAVYALTAAAGSPLADRADVSILVPHDDTARIQEIHLFLGHLLCHGLETRLGGWTRT